jgi:hypothetical protein
MRARNIIEEVVLADRRHGFISSPARNFMHLAPDLFGAIAVAQRDFIRRRIQSAKDMVRVRSLFSCSRRDSPYSRTLSFLSGPECRYTCYRTVGSADRLHLRHCACRSSSRLHPLHVPPPNNHDPTVSAILLPPLFVFLDLDLLRHGRGGAKTRLFVNI